MRFLYLRQEDMSVVEYEVKFLELSRFVPEYVNTEVEGQKKEIIVEGEREAAKRENEGRKRKFESSKQEQGSSKFRGKFGKNVEVKIKSIRSVNSGMELKRIIFRRPDCRGRIVDLRFKSVKFVGRDTQKDAVQDVVAGTIVINSVELEVLMNSGATRSFITESILDRLKYDAYPLEPNLIREVANQERVTVNRICPDCDLIIEGRHFPADLIHFKLGEFDVILGMDWLSNHEAEIECKSKKVKLKTKDGVEVILK
ncbi:hypothetical protein AgCh_028213 [Apium graveolens]